MQLPMSASMALPINLRRWMFDRWVTQKEKEREAEAAAQRKAKRK